MKMCLRLADCDFSSSPSKDPTMCTFWGISSLFVEVSTFGWFFPFQNVIANLSVSVARVCVYMIHWIKTSLKLSLVPKRSLLIRCPCEVWERERREDGEYLSVTSQLMVESRNDRAKNAWGLGCLKLSFALFISATFKDGRMGRFKVFPSLLCWSLNSLKCDGQCLFLSYCHSRFACERLFPTGKECPEECALL